MRACPPPIPHPRRSTSKSPVPAPVISRLDADVLPGKTSHGVFRSSRNCLRSSRFPARSRVKDSGFTRNVLRCNGDGGNSSVFEPGNQRRGTSDPVAFDFLELKRELEKEERGVGSVGSSEEEEDEVVLPEISGKASLESEEEEEEEEEENVVRIVRRKVVGRGRQMLKRSSLLAKQVISMQSACCLGFISQLWVDTTSWMVVVIEVRPSILSGENDKFLLKDICQVGDVVLVQDESVIENELRMIGLDTLVGYNVVTSGRRNVGKVRGYNFNINSGAVESLELDSFGMSILPSSLVSTFSLLIEDVLEAVPDTIVVQDDAISRVQRLTKGLWGTQSVAFPTDDIEEYTDFRRLRRHVDDNRRRRTKFRDFPSRTREINDDWDLPMEY